MYTGFTELVIGMNPSYVLPISKTFTDNMSEIIRTAMDRCGLTSDPTTNEIVPKDDHDMELDMFAWHHPITAGGCHLGLPHWKKIKEEGLPRRATKYSAGYDLRAMTTSITGLTLSPGAYSKIKTGLVLSKNFPRSTHYVRLTPRSSWWAKGVAIEGVIDGDYEGEIYIGARSIKMMGVIKVDNGASICQAIVTPYAILEKHVPIQERGEGGFGSTTRVITATEMAPSTLELEPEVIIDLCCNEEMLEDSMPDNEQEEQEKAREGEQYFTLVPDEEDDTDTTILDDPPEPPPKKKAKKRVKSFVRDRCSEMEDAVTREQLAFIPLEDTVLTFWQQQDTLKAVRDQVPDEQTLWLVSKSIGADWKGIGITLALRKATLECIQLDNPWSKDYYGKGKDGMTRWYSAMAFEMLMKWSNTYQDKGKTFASLQRALTLNQRADLWDIVDHRACVWTTIKCGNWRCPVGNK